MRTRPQRGMPHFLQLQPKPHLLYYKLKACKLKLNRANDARESLVPQS